MGQKDRRSLPPPDGPGQDMQPGPQSTLVRRVSAGCHASPLPSPSGTDTSRSLLTVARSRRRHGARFSPGRSRPRWPAPCHALSVLKVAYGWLTPVVEKTHVGVQDYEFQRHDPHRRPARLAAPETPPGSRSTARNRRRADGYAGISLRRSSSASAPSRACLHADLGPRSRRHPMASGRRSVAAVRGSLSLAAKRSVSGRPVDDA